MEADTMAWSVSFHLLVAFVVVNHWKPCSWAWSAVRSRRMSKHMEPGLSLRIDVGFYMSTSKNSGSLFGGLL